MDPDKPHGPPLQPTSPPPQPDRGGTRDDAATEAGPSSDSVLSSPTPTQPEPEPSGQGDDNTRPPANTPSAQSTWSVTSDRQTSHGSQQDPTDRVFPIRSVVSVEPHGRTSGEHDYFGRSAHASLAEGSHQRPASIKVETESSNRRASIATNESMSSAAAAAAGGMTSPIDRGRRRRMHPAGGAVSSVQADAERHGTVGPIPLFTNEGSDEEKSEATGPAAGSQTSEKRTRDEIAAADEDMTTVRFQHVVTDEGHAVITGREGKLQRCEDEPIHTPGAVQSFGLLLTIREEADGSFLVRHASENSRAILGYSPQELFRLDNFLDIWTDEQADNLLDHIDFIRDEDADPAINGPEVFSISIRPPKKKSVKLWCAIHLCPSQADLVICEFELDDDHEHPLRPADELTPDVPEDTLHSNPTLEELTESTEISSKPLRVLRSARKRRGEAGAMQVFDIMSQVQEQLATAPNLEKFLKILVGIIKELTGFHRVMIYQFDSSFNGKVVTELVDPIQTRDLYKGLHFPASDIPKQARELYKLNRVRLLYDRDLETARIVCRSVDDLENPLDMTHAYLRAMSPIHLKYLANMAVRSSMSISINAFNELWGLIACHSYGMKGMRVSFPIRKMCRLVGDTVSRNIERLSYASRLQARKLINTVPTDKNPSGYIIASSDDLLKLFDADFGMLSIKGETKILGKLEQSQEALAMLEYVRLRKFTSVVTSQDIMEDFPDLRYLPGFAVIAGLLYVPLSVGGNDFIVFFRKGQAREVKWAGNPYEKTIQEGTQYYLEPRKSFKTWHETVVGKCREWSEEQVETAAVLCLVYGKFIEVWRQKEAALQSSKLTRLLLANSAHEVRTPLNAIINYLEIALEGSLDQETRDNLAKSHSASKSLIYVINDLLDLTKTEEGQDLVKDERFDLPACIHEATEAFKSDAKRKGINYEVIEHPGLPRYVFGDQRRVRQAVANVTANAVQNTQSGSVKIELYVTEIQDTRVRVEIVIQDTGRGMSNSQLDELFRDLEQVTTELDESGPVEEQEQGVPENVRTLGLGLAVVARIVRNMDGQLRLKSEEGKGSRFVIQLPFEIPSSDSPDAPEIPGSAVESAAASTVASISTTLPADNDGEVTLVDRGSSSSVKNLPEKKSMDDVRSLASKGSGTSKGSGQSAKSDADRLIDAIQTPLALGEPEAEDNSLRRRRSRGAYYNPGGSTAPGAGNSRSISPQQRPERPSNLLRSLSSPGAKMGDDDEVADRTAGLEFVTDSKTPIKPIKVPDEYTDLPEHPQPATESRVLFEIPDKPAPAPAPATVPEPQPKNSSLQVLIAEDDPVNFKILSKRLEKVGHHVSHAVNGEDCAQMYSEKSNDYNVVLMDMQMPIVDGLSSTKRIRELERTDGHSGLSALASRHGRTPIFAVSASLVEREKDTYVNAGFDGWILKPIDFKRLETLLSGISNDAVRNECVYKAGEWERGGWFATRLSPRAAEKMPATASTT